MKKTLRTPYFLSLFASLGLLLAPIGCGGKEDDEGMADDGDTVGDGDGDNDMTGDGDGDQTGDGDGDMTGDGDGDMTGDGDGDMTGDGDGDCMGDLEAGAGCNSPCECASGNCYVVPILGGQCGECDEDADCAEGGCTPPNPFENNGPTCNMGEAGGGCETDDVCQEGLSCGNVLDLLGLVQINTCGECQEDAECDEGLICAPDVSVEEFSGINTCMAPGTLENNKFCQLEGNGNEACMSGICSSVNIMDLAEIGACGECNTDADCNGGTCQAGEFVLDGGMLTGSTCI